MLVFAVGLTGWGGEPAQGVLLAAPRELRYLTLHRQKQRDRGAVLVGLSGQMGMLKQGE